VGAGGASEAGHHRAAIVASGVRKIEPLQRALGPRVADVLRRDRQVEAESGLILEILLAGQAAFRHDGPVFVPWAHDPLIDKVEKMHPPAICAQPWAPNDLSVWRRSLALADLPQGRCAIRAFGEPRTVLQCVGAARASTALLNVAICPTDESTGSG
jgi:hypothetical protein